MKVLKLELIDIVEIHDELIKIGDGDYGLQNSSSIDYALSHIKYNNTKNEFFHNLALLLRNITELHPFLDGNKRTGIAIIEIILMDNKLKLKLNNKQKEKLVLDVAQGKFSDLEKLSKFLKKNIY
jgi:death-on-curing protein